MRVGFPLHFSACTTISDRSTHKTDTHCKPTETLRRNTPTRPVPHTQWSVGLASNHLGAGSSHSEPGLQSVYMNWHHHQSLFHQCLMQILFVWLLFFWRAVLKKWMCEERARRRGCAPVSYCTLMQTGFSVSVHSHNITQRYQCGLHFHFDLERCCGWAPLSHNAVHKGHRARSESLLQNIKNSSQMLKRQLEWEHRTAADTNKQVRQRKRKGRKTHWNWIILFKDHKHKTFWWTHLLSCQEDKYHFDVCVTSAKLEPAPD